MANVVLKNNLELQNKNNEYIKIKTKSNIIYVTVTMIILLCVSRIVRVVSNITFNDIHKRYKEKVGVILPILLSISILLMILDSFVRKSIEILISMKLYKIIIKEMIDFDNTIVLCLGLGELTPEDIVTQCVTYDTEESWTYGLSEEYLLEHAQDWYNCNEMLKIECPKYGINYIDTSKDRERENLFK